VIPVPFTTETVAEALAEVRARIERAGGGPHVEILPVTKGFGPEAIEAVMAAGATAIGENYVQELIGKLDALAGRGAPMPAVHLIGQLQTNKVRHAAGRIACYESVDRAKLATEIARRDPGAWVLIQVDTAGEPGKGGCPVEALDELADHVRGLGLTLDGLMTVGPTEGGPEAARTGFRAVRAAADRLGLTTCSMGMTADLEVAVQEGSTRVRVGTALFGARAVHPGHHEAR
jgi:pyridoxal phosphate enzyme (YggS family)